MSQKRSAAARQAALRYCGKLVVSCAEAAPVLQPAPQPLNAVVESGVWALERLRAFVGGITASMPRSSANISRARTSAATRAPRTASTPPRRHRSAYRRPAPRAGKRCANHHGEEAQPERDERQRQAEAGKQRLGDWAYHEGAHAEAHRGEPRDKAAPIGEPAEQDRERHDIGQPDADTADQRAPARPL